MPKKTLLDTNIIIHRETPTTVEPNIGILFKWFDELKYIKCVHPVTIEEINKHKDPKTVKSFNVKLTSYTILKTVAPLSPSVASICSKLDKEENDHNDTVLLNELINNRVDLLITEDKRIFEKALLLGISDRVFTIDSFLEKAIAENPQLIEYKVLSVKQELFGNINLADEFFGTFKEDYPRFEQWFNKKAEETAYICVNDRKLLAFLYLKVETPDEDYSDILPTFQKKRRLKIGTFKVDYNGFKLGERFLKIIFDNAAKLKVDEIYVTIFDKRLEQKRLINLLENFGFVYFGKKNQSELVYVRDFSPKVNRETPKISFPFVSAQSSVFLVPIYQKYHTSLLPDSILKTESPANFEEHEPFRNAISKVYISRSIERGLNPGDVIIFYRTGGRYRAVITTIGIVEDVTTGIKDVQEFIRLCGKRSVFQKEELVEQWNFKPQYRPFVVYFLYAYSFPKRITLDDLIRLGIIPDVESAPRGFTKITSAQFRQILKETQTDERLIVH